MASTPTTRSAARAVASAGQNRLSGPSLVRIPRPSGAVKSITITPTASTGINRHLSPLDHTHPTGVDSKGRKLFRWIEWKKRANRITLWTRNATTRIAIH